MRVVDYDLLHGWNRVDSLLCRSGPVCLVVRKLSGTDDAGVLKVLPVAMVNRYRAMKDVAVALARSQRGVLLVQTEDVEVSYALLKTLGTLVNISTTVIPEEFAYERFRPIDAVPWHVHLIEDEDAYASALEGFLDNDVA